MSTTASHLWIRAPLLLAHGGSLGSKAELLIRRPLLCLGVDLEWRSSGSYLRVEPTAVLQLSGSAGLAPRAACWTLHVGTPGTAPEAAPVTMQPPHVEFGLGPHRPRVAAFFCELPPAEAGDA